MIYWDHSELKKYPSWSLKENKLSKVKKKNVSLPPESTYPCAFDFFSNKKNSGNCIWKSGFLAPLTILKVKKLIHSTLVGGHQPELVVSLAFGERVTMQFFLPLLPRHTFSSWSHKLLNRDRGSETHAPSPLCSELSGQLFCYVYLRLCVWSALAIGTPQVFCFFQWFFICDQLPPPCWSSQGIPGFMEKNQAGTFFTPYSLQFHFLRNCLFDEFLFPNVSYPVLRFLI